MSTVRMALLLSSKFLRIVRVVRAASDADAPFPLHLAVEGGERWAGRARKPFLRLAWLDRSEERRRARQILLQPRPRCRRGHVGDDPPRVDDRQEERLAPEPLARETDHVPPPAPGA